MVRKKICVLGAIAVGKTSLLRRFVHGIFSSQYQATIGVKIDTKRLETEHGSVQMVLWDLDGAADFEKVRGRYMKGCAGYFLVIDGTRPETVRQALAIRDAVAEVDGAPCLCLLNKRDLADDEWKLDQEAYSQLERAGLEILETSAKTGLGVDEAFALLAHRILTQ